MPQLRKYSNTLIELTITGIVAAIFLILKLWYRNTSTDDLQFLLSPINKIISLFTGAHSNYKPQEGYYFKDLDIIIDKSCSGFNFFLISFVMISFLIIPRCHRPLLKTSTLLASIIIAYTLTLFTNSSRIIVSIFSNRITPLSWNHYYPIIHESIGVIVYLSCLVSFYLLLDKITPKNLAREKSF